MRFLIAIVCCLVLFVDLPTVSAKTCGKDEYKVTLEVRTRFRQKSVVKAYTYTEKIRSSKTFKKLLEKMSTEASISGSYGAFSASASAAYSSLTDSVQSNENNAKDVKIDETTFNKDFLQIFQEVVTKVSIDGKTATKTKTEFVNSVPVTEPWSSKRLRDEAAAYMDYEFPEGAKRNRFTETVCRKREVKGKDKLGLSCSWLSCWSKKIFVPKFERGGMNIGQNPIFPIYSIFPPSIFYLFSQFASFFTIIIPIFYIFFISPMFFI